MNEVKLYAFRDLSKCTKDCMCLYVCPTGATDNETGQINKDACIGCGVCANACPSRAILMLPINYPKEQVHQEVIINMMKKLASSKIEQEQLLDGLDVQGQTINLLKKAFAKSNRIMCEDILREAGYMIPQGKESFKFLQKLEDEYPTLKEEINKLRKMLSDSRPLEDIKDDKQEEKFKPSGNTKQWVCSVCGYVHDGDTPPETCPICLNPASAFEPKN